MMASNLTKMFIQFLCVVSAIYQSHAAHIQRIARSDRREAVPKQTLQYDLRHGQVLTLSPQSVVQDILRLDSVSRVGFDCGNNGAAMQVADSWERSIWAEGTVMEADWQNDIGFRFLGHRITVEGTSIKMAKAGDERVISDQENREAVTRDSVHILRTDMEAIDTGHGITVTGTNGLTYEKDGDFLVVTGAALQLDGAEFQEAILLPLTGQSSSPQPEISWR